MADISLPDDKYKEIIRLSRLYYRQAKRCQDGKAFLAGCIMMGASLEATLLGFTNCFPEEAASSIFAPHKGKTVKPLMNWSLADLLAVAKDLKWLPAALSSEEGWSNAKAEIGDYAEVVREIRNLVHPARYAADYPRRRITENYLDGLFEIVETATDYLRAKLTVSLNALMEEHERRAAKKISGKKQLTT